MFTSPTINTDKQCSHHQPYKQTNNVYITNHNSQAAKAVFWPNPASAVKVFFLWIITHQMFYEAYSPDIKRISLSVLRKITKSKVIVQSSRSIIFIFKIELQTSVIPLFHLILTEKNIFGIIFMIEVHL